MTAQYFKTQEINGKTVRFSGLPKPLHVVQVNVPASVLLMFVIVSTFPSCTTPVFPWFPGFSLVQVMFGSTRLDTLQSNCKLSPSRTVDSPLIFHWYLLKLRATKQSQVNFKDSWMAFTFTAYMDKQCAKLIYCWHDF